MTQLPEQTTKNQPADLEAVNNSITKLIQANNTNNNIKLNNPLCLFALTCHAFLISNQFRLTLPSTQHPNSDHDPALSTDWDSLLVPNQLALLFNYSHPQSSLSFEFSFSKIGNRLSIGAIAVQDDRLSTWDLSVPEYVDPSHFPITLTKDQQIDALGFRSSTHLLNFISLFINKILNPLLPDLFPETTSIIQRSPPRNQTSNQNSSGNARVLQPGPVPEERSYPPAQAYRPAQSPFEIGRSDLEPIGTSGLRIPSLYNQPSGMLVQPTHPLFTHPPPLGQPESLHPPGARFDPIGPNTSPAFSRPRPGFDLDPMGGLGQGLPLHNPHLGFRPDRPDFNDFRPPRGGPGSGGYDDMFM